MVRQKSIYCVKIMDLIFPTEPTSYVRAEFNTRRDRNPSYSVRAFARDLGVSPSHLSEFLSGKANLSYDRAPSLAEKLNLKGEHREHWCDLLSIHSKLKKDRDAAGFRISQRLENSKGSVSQKVFKAISDWHYFAILSYFGACPDLTAKDIAKRLSFSQSKVQKSIELLVDLKLLKVSERGFETTDDYSLVGNTVPSEAIRESHRQILKQAVKALETYDMTDRESQSLFVTVPQSEFAAFKEAVRASILQLAAQYSRSKLPKDKVRVQALTLQIFPVDVKADKPSRLRVGAASKGDES